MEKELPIEEKIEKYLKHNKVDYVIYLPTSKIVQTLNRLQANGGFEMIPVGKEEEMFGISAGLSLAGKKSAIFTQESGIGNSLLVLSSLIVAYDFPLLVFVADDRENDKDILPKQKLSHDMIEILKFLESKGDLVLHNVSNLNSITHIEGRNIILI